MKIGICDDDLGQLTLLKAQIKEVCAMRDISDISITAYSSGNELLESELVRMFDIVFLDIDMPELSGMETAQKLRERECEALIVFVTSYQEYMRDAFKVEAFDYLVKPVVIRELDNVIQRCVQKHEQRYGKLSIKTIEKENTVLSCKKIVLLQSRLHHIDIVMNDGTRHTALMRLDQIGEELRDYVQFARCHQSYIVNLDYVESILQSSFKLKKQFQYIQKEVPISRKYLSSMKERYLKYHLF